jgi:hypothetical protein
MAAFLFVGAGAAFAVEAALVSVGITAVLALPVSKAGKSSD